MTAATVTRSRQNNSTMVATSFPGNSSPTHGAPKTPSLNPNIVTRNKRPILTVANVIAGGEVCSPNQRDRVAQLNLNAIKNSQQREYPTSSYQAGTHFSTQRGLNRSLMESSTDQQYHQKRQIVTRGSTREERSAAYTELAYAGSIAQ